MSLFSKLNGDLIAEGETVSVGEASSEMAAALVQVGFVLHEGKYTLAVAWNDSLVQELRKVYRPEKWQLFCRVMRAIAKNLGRDFEERVQ